MKKKNVWLRRLLFNNLWQHRSECSLWLHMSKVKQTFKGLIHSIILWNKKKKKRIIFPYNGSEIRPALMQKMQKQKMQKHHRMIPCDTCCSLYFKYSVSLVKNKPRLYGLFNENSDLGHWFLCVSKQHSIFILEWISLFKSIGIFKWIIEWIKEWISESLTCHLLPH